MSDNPIPPALSAEEWAAKGEPVVDGCIDWDMQIVDVASRYSTKEQSQRFIPALIALANAALPDSDTRKITREWVGLLRDAQHTAEARHDQSFELVDYENYQMFQRMADVLESYLPPAGT